MFWKSFPFLVFLPVGRVEELVVEQTTSDIEAAAGGLHRATGRLDISEREFDFLLHPAAF